MEVGQKESPGVCGPERLADEAANTRGPVLNNPEGAIIPEVVLGLLYI